MIDWHRVAELKEEVGVDDFEEIANLFLTEVEDRIAVLSNHLDAAHLAAVLHDIRGSALNVGFADLARITGTFEALAEQDQAQAVEIGSVRACFLASQAVFLAGRSPRTGTG